MYIRGDMPIIVFISFISVHTLGKFALNAVHLRRGLYRVRVSYTRRLRFSGKHG